MIKCSWEKYGLIFRTNGEGGWMNSHAQGPTALLIDNKLRIFFSSRPAKNLSLPTFIDVDRDDPKKILFINKEPILELGDPGSFDEHGVIPKYILQVGNNFYLYYIGWSRKVNTPYSLSIGLAISNDGFQFKKYSKGPILGINQDDHLSVTAPCVFFEEGKYYMYYTAGLDWFNIDDRWEHTYTIRRAVSDNGIDWDRDYVNIIHQKDKYECISNPTILKIDNIYHMWFCFKGTLAFRSDISESYKIGYAYSHNNKDWIRDEENAGIHVSSNCNDWDSLMIEYPHIFKVNEKYYLLYNGNGFGETGFGYAKLNIKNT